MPRPNPYSPPTHSNDEAKPSSARRQTVWQRNALAMACTVISYSTVILVFELTLERRPETASLAFLVVAAFTSLWANLPILFRIGIGQGGIPILFVAYFAAVAAYGIAALFAGELLLITLSSLQP